MDYAAVKTVASVEARFHGRASVADEIAAGYFSYFRDYWRELMTKGQVRRAWHEMRHYTVTHEQRLGTLLLETVEGAGQWRLSGLSAYRKLGVRRRRRALADDPWFRPGLSEWNVPESATVRHPFGLDAALKRSVSRLHLPLYLRLEDRNSMAHSIEARLPFLDYRVAEFAYALPDEWKLRGPWNKFVLRQAMEGRIPESVRLRADKMGFPVPARKWFAGQLFEPVMDLLSSRRTIESGRYRMDAVKRDLDRHRRGE